MSRKKTISCLKSGIRSDFFGGILAATTRMLLVSGLLLSGFTAWAAVNTFQEGVSSYNGTQDTYLEQDNPNSAHGTENTVLVESDGSQVQHGLLRFDNIFGSGAGQIPLGSVINSATLTIEIDNTSSATAQIRLHRMLLSWPETATWNSMTNGIQANDIEAMSAFDAQVSDPTNSGTETITGLAAALQAWSDGSPNYGWAFINSTDDGWDFFASEEGTVASRPLLTVDWSPGLCPGGVVSTTADSLTTGSLRACINWANGNPGTTIVFNIPGPGNRSAGGDSWWAISPATPLPAITAAGTVIDATTQTSNQGDTNSIGPEIELDGVSAGGGAHGLDIAATADGSTIRGLMINRFSANGIQVQSGANNLTIAGNWIGSDGSGASAPGNGANGINMLGGDSTIGGTGAGDSNVINNNGNEGINLTGGGATGNTMLGNIIGLEYDGTSGSGNGDVGIAILAGASGNTVGGVTVEARNIISMNFEGVEINSANNVITGNYIGTDAGGTLDRGNRSDDGIEIQGGGDNNTIGGIAPGAGNLIAFNQNHGVNVAAGNGNAILGNSIHSNDLRGIDLGNDGVTANDAGDGDSGANDLLNFPVIVSATEIAGTIDVYYALDVPAGNYRIEFFVNPAGADPSGNGEGEVFADGIAVSHAGAGVQYYFHALSGSAGDLITVTATEQLAGPSFAATSEFSAAVTATAFSQFSARWPLDETSGTTAADIDAGNDGTYMNGVLLNQSAACLNTGTGVRFDGNNDYVEVPHSPDYLMDEGTISVWINVDAIGAEQMFFSKDHLNFGTGGHLSMSVQPAGQVQTRLQSTVASMYVTGAPISAGVWTHVAFSWGPGGMALYIDGAAPITDPYTGGLGTTSGGAGNFEPIAFGASTVVSGVGVVTPLENYFAGYLDDVRIYNRALTQPEINTLAGCADSLDLVKRAFWLDGTAIPSGAVIPSGVEFKYLLYINNPGGLRSDVTVRDALDPAFQYQPGTIQVDNSLGECAAMTCTALEEQAIFAAVNGTALLTDAIDGDSASYDIPGTTVDAGNGNVGNPQLDINGSGVWAILFSAKMP